MAHPLATADESTQVCSAIDGRSSCQQLLTSCLQANHIPAHFGGNAKGRTDISRVAAYFDRPINEAAQILGAPREALHFVPTDD